MIQADFDFLAGYLRARSGMMLSSDKQYLLEHRLLPLARRAGLRDIGEIAARLRRSPDDPLGVEVVDAMTIGETFFFRDRDPFDAFRDRILPDLLAARSRTRTLRIWCAACALGQEPYSLAMLLREMDVDLQGWKIEIVATDLVGGVVERAKRGVYSQFEVQRGLPVKLLLKYFTQVDEAWQIAPSIREMVRFKQLNLLHDFSALGTFDVVFCRNVLIYFDVPTKIDVLERLSRAVSPAGALLLGGAETTVGLTGAFAAHPKARLFLQPVQSQSQTQRHPQPPLRLVRA